MSEGTGRNFARAIDLACMALLVVAVALVFLELVVPGRILYLIPGLGSRHLFEMRRAGMLLWVLAGILGVVAAAGHRIKYALILFALPLIVAIIMFLMVSH